MRAYPGFMLGKLQRHGLSLAELSFAWMCDGSTLGVDLVSKLAMSINAGTPGTDLLTAGGVFGMGLSIAASPTANTRLISAAQPLAYGANHTMIVAAHVTVNPAANKALAGVDGASSSHALDIGVTSTGDLRVQTRTMPTTRTHTVTGGADVGNPHIYAFSYTSGAASPVIYVDGVAQTVSSTGSTTISAQTTRRFVVQGSTAGLGLVGCGTVFFVGHWPRILTPTEVMRSSLALRKVLK